ncbi:hypothetical protein DHEL01_v207849 [Diaporthe helianthi]|uniref:F-box domain-containing protein n=1 Tax=Diaporthe helianthi TaxID=158607 RepID=A0A2P5HU37_DIAHE|nr:hypothetical protein DHEL01_v207849 [Diaporthe helianthi]
MMAADLLRVFDLASPSTREQFIVGMAERLGNDELRCFQDAQRRLDHRFDILCGQSNISGARLPHEIQLQIVSLLGITEIYYCTNVSRQWRCLLLQCRPLTDDLFKKYFPAYLDKMSDGSERLHQALRKRYLRDSGRFRTRFTCGVFKNADGTFAMDRVEGLERGRAFKDLACAGSNSLRPPFSARTARNSSPEVSPTPYQSSGSAIRMGLTVASRRSCHSSDSAEQIPISGLELNDLTIMFHPRDEHVFFLAIYNDKYLNPNEVWVCEFRKKQCCQIFTYRIPIPSHRPDSIISNARLIDAHGTYQLLEQRPRSSEGVQICGVTFNTISKSFGTFRFQAPNNTDAERFLIWNEQLVLKYDPEVPKISSWPLLVVGPSPRSGSLEAAASAAAEDQSLELAMERMIKAATSLGTAHSSVAPSHRLRTMMEALERKSQRHDIIRAPDIPESIPELFTAIGLRYIVLFSNGQCNWEGGHVGNCPGLFGLPNPLVRSWATDGDDDFLVIFSQNYYTVFAVDEDGEIAKAMRESTNSRAVEVSYESDQHTGSEHLDT